MLDWGLVMKISDTVSGLIFILAGAGIAIEAQSFPAIAGQPYGSTFFPTLIGIAMAIGGFCLAGNAVIRKTVLPLVVLPDWLKSPRGIGSFVLILGSLIFYMALAERLGFILTAFLLIVVLQKWMGAKLLPALAIAALATGLFYTVFAILLRVPLPHGVVEQLF